MPILFGDFLQFRPISNLFGLGKIVFESLLFIKAIPHRFELKTLLRFDPFDVTEMPMAPHPRIRVLNRLLFNGIQSERGSQQDGFELAHENLATHGKFGILIFSGV